MSIRYSTSLLGLCLATAAAGLLSPVAAQRWVMPRTPDGRPDLQGNWNNETLTPFQRPIGQGLVLTSDEVDRIEGRRADQVEEGSERSDPNRPPPSVTGEIGRSYNEIYYTIDDPRTYTQPWGGEIPFRKVDHLLYEYACHEGNYALSNILTSARYLEGQAAQNRREQR